jgi:hypothetical protein
MMVRVLRRSERRERWMLRTSCYRGGRKRRRIPRCLAAAGTRIACSATARAGGGNSSHTSTWILLSSNFNIRITTNKHTVIACLRYLR